MNFHAHLNGQQYRAVATFEKESGFCLMTIFLSTNCCESEITQVIKLMNELSFILTHQCIDRDSETVKIDFVVRGDDQFIVSALSHLGMTELDIKELVNVMSVKDMVKNIISHKKSPPKV